MTALAIPTLFIAIAIVIVRRGDRIVLVEETRDRGGDLPGGRIEPGEDLVRGALRELRLRAPEVEALLRHVHEGAHLHPLSLLASEGAPLPRETEPEATRRASGGRLPAT